MMTKARAAARLLASVLALLVLLAPSAAAAFCGFYVGGADAKLFNDATIVVMMRDGTKTVLSMQNNYKGPPEDFALVVPVPVVLQEENVKTLPSELFGRVDTAAAPRLVEYWEQDPCPPPEMPSFDDRRYEMSAAAPGAAAAKGLGVKIEAEFVVGEYNIVILSADDALGLDTWLRRENYRIPEGAEPILRPYVQAGMKFFVAKVIASKVKFEDGRAVLSPLRFHYDSETFSLPIRLGLVSSSGTQDLIVHILAKERYEVANYKNVTIPTNLDVTEEARDRFGEFYAALFDRTLEENPGAVITEYAWSAGSCDPCPAPSLTPQEIMTLGGDVLPKGEEDAPDDPVIWRRTRDLVLTRLHARYGKESLGEDLVFRKAGGIVGGREDFGPTAEKPLPQDATPSSTNNFQGRYAIRHPWTGPITCLSPRRGVWGGPPAGHEGPRGTVAARDLASAPRGGVKLASFLRTDVGVLAVVGEGPKVSAAPIGTGPAIRIGIALGVAAFAGLILVVARRVGRKAA